MCASKSQNVCVCMCGGNDEGKRVNTVREQTSRHAEKCEPSGGFSKRREGLSLAPPLQLGFHLSTPGFSDTTRTRTEGSFLWTKPMGCNAGIPEYKERSVWILIEEISPVKKKRKGKCMNTMLVKLSGIEGSVVCTWPWNFCYNARIRV